MKKIDKLNARQFHKKRLIITRFIEMSDTFNQMAFGGSPTRMYFSMGGNTLNILGTFFQAAAFIVGIWKISGYGKDAMASLPLLLGTRQPTDEEKKQPLVTKDQVITETRTFALITGIGLLSTVVKYFGAWLSNESTIMSVSKWIAGFTFK